jgi:hypothetical protein
LEPFSGVCWNDLRRFVDNVDNKVLVHAGHVIRAMNAKTVEARMQNCVQAWQKAFLRTSR